MYKRKGCKFYAPLAKGDSPQCGEMSRSDRGDGRPLGGSGVAAGGIAPEVNLIVMWVDKNKMRADAIRPYGIVGFQKGLS